MLGHVRGLHVQVYQGRVYQGGYRRAGYTGQASRKPRNDQNDHFAQMSRKCHYCRVRKSDVPDPLRAVCYATFRPGTTLGKPKAVSSQLV